MRDVLPRTLSGSGTGPTSPRGASKQTGFASVMCLRTWTRPVPACEYRLGDLAPRPEGTGVFRNEPVRRERSGKTELRRPSPTYSTLSLSHFTVSDPVYHSCEPPPRFVVRSYEGDGEHGGPRHERCVTGSEGDSGEPEPISGYVRDRRMPTPGGTPRSGPGEVNHPGSAQLSVVRHQGPPEQSTGQGGEIRGSQRGTRPSRPARSTKRQHFIHKSEETDRS